jgi:hypothetical protein
MNKRMGLVLTIGMGAVLSTATATEPGSERGRAAAPQLEGTWVHTVTPIGPPDPPRFYALHTYSQGGTLVESFQLDETPPVSGPGQEVWERLDGDSLSPL